MRAGVNTVQPYHENPPEVQLADGDVVFVDLGPVFDGWEADVGRSWVLGNDPENQRLVDATFEKSGDPLKSYAETIRAGGDELVCSWSNMRDPMMLHTQPGTPAGRPYSR